jgi:hypothetical protein
MFSSGQLTPEQFAQKAAAKGYKWAALEYDDPAFDPLTWYPEFHYHCLLHDILPGVWFTNGGEIYKTPSDAAFAIAEVEGPGDLEGVTNVINGVGGGPLPTCSLAIVTNFSTLTRENSRPLIDAGMTCLTECYMNEHLNSTPDSMNFIARNLGWPTSQPVAGMYPTASQPNPAPLYDQWRDWPMADYLMENTLS